MVKWLLPRQITGERTAFSIKAARKTGYPHAKVGLLSNTGGGLVAKSCLTLATPWIVACQTPMSMGFSRQEYWSGLPFPSPGALPDPGIEPRSPGLQADSLPTELQGEPYLTLNCQLIAN